MLLFCYVKIGVGKIYRYLTKMKALYVVVNNNEVTITLVIEDNKWIVYFVRICLKLIEALLQQDHSNRFIFVENCRC